MSEEVRRVIAWVLACGGWIASFVLALYASLNFDPSTGDFAPAWFTPTEIILIGIAIASGTALGRMRSVETITKVFRAGTMAALEDEETQKKKDEE